MDKLQEMLRSTKDRKGDKLLVIHILSVQTMFEILANQFNIYIDQTMPQQASVFQKITEFVQQLSIGFRWKTIVSRIV